MYTKIKTYNENVLVPRNLEGRQDKLRQETIKILSQEIINGNFEFQKWMLDISNELVKVRAINGNLDCSYMDLTELPRWFENIEIVTGSMFINNNKLKTLQNCPHTVNKNFYCYNNNLVNLEGSPRIIGMDFNCNSNDLTSLKGAPDEIGNRFNCKNNKLTSLEHGPKLVKGNYYCSNNLVRNLSPSEDCVILGYLYNK